MPQENANPIAGCDMDLGFRVQYSDLAMLQWVQLQILDANQAIVVDNLDNSTRAEWDDVRAKNITWSIPADLIPGDYILRAFGDAYYHCTENGIRTLCPLPLEDRETIHINAPLDLENDPSSSPSECPASLTPFSKSETSSESSMSSPSPSSPSSSSSASTPIAPLLHFIIDSDVLNLIQHNVHLAKQQDQEQKTATEHFGEGRQGLSVETGRKLSQKADSTSDGEANSKDGMKKDGSEPAINGAGGAERCMHAGRVGSGMSLVVLLAATLVLL
ncbi:hypothetical protein BGZ47_005143 [Haplosporangium gracile]|nr:hypothetical protein BGZ47_005143 [Haplosporangium gracile]